MTLPREPLAPPFACFLICPGFSRLNQTEVLLDALWRRRLAALGAVVSVRWPIDADIPAEGAGGAQQQRKGASQSAELAVAAALRSLSKAFPGPLIVVGTGVAAAAALTGSAMAETRVVGTICLAPPEVEPEQLQPDPAARAFVTAAKKMKRARLMFVVGAQGAREAEGMNELRASLAVETSVARVADADKFLQRYDQDIALQHVSDHQTMAALRDFVSRCVFPKEGSARRR